MDISGRWVFWRFDILLKLTPFLHLMNLGRVDCRMTRARVELGNPPNYPTINFLTADCRHWTRHPLLGILLDTVLMTIETRDFQVVTTHWQFDWEDILFHWFSFSSLVQWISFLNYWMLACFWNAGGTDSVSPERCTTVISESAKAWWRVECVYWTDDI